MAEAKKVELTEEELQQQAQKLSQEKMQAFVDDYNKVVEKHKMQLVGVANITPEGVTTAVDIRPVQGK
jgi:histidinol dehydrogenase